MTQGYRQVRFAACGLAAALLLISAVPAGAQQQGPFYPNARLTALVPTGGKVGATVEVTIGGADLEEANALYFSHPGLKAAQVPDPMKPGSFVANKFSVTIAPDVPVGYYDVRAIGKYGMSNPRTFVVGDLNEVLEKEPNNDIPQAQKVELNTVLHGAITQNVDVDYFSFAGKKGQRVLIVCEASSIDSRANPFVQLFDSSNRLLTSNRRYADRDAVLDWVLPADGDYLLRLCEHAYLAGSPEYYYRLTVSLGPWIDAVYPPVVEPGKPAQITLYGRNLPGGQPDPQATVDDRPVDKLVVTVNAPNDPLALQRLTFTGITDPGSAMLDGFEHRVKNAVGSSNPILLTYAQGRVVLENDSNDTPDKAQELPVPCDVCGRIEKRRDRDCFVFAAKQNEAYTIEAFAQRIGAPFELYFEIRRVDNKQSIGEFESTVEPVTPASSKFYPLNADPKTRFVVPADGKYELLVGSRTSDLQASIRHIYRISIRKEAPDFRLVLVHSNDNNPAGSLVRQGGSDYLHVYCFRNDNFTGEVTVSVEGLPPGVTCPPQVIGQGMKTTPLVLTAAADAAAWTGEIKVKGTATINGQPVVREARAGAITWPIQPGQGVPAIGRLVRSVCLSVGEKGMYSLEASIQEIAVPAGANAALKLKINRIAPDFKAPVQVTALDLPANLTFNNGQPLAIPADKNEVDALFQVRNNVAPGVYNLVVRGAGQVQFTKDPTGKNKQNINMIEPSTPIKLTVYTAVADVSVSSPEVTVKVGTDAELTVKVNRLHDYKGEFKVQLVLPQGFQGVTAPEVTIPEGANEAKFILKAAANAAAATNPNVVVRAVATVEKIPLNHDAKLAVTIAK